uniref:FP protein C-terminal domain-containing protein n=1 Tax=Cacopsylla melanoneura TaxID=428564 RepID=A0A8D9E8L9_9HEMI
MGPKKSSDNDDNDDIEIVEDKNGLLDLLRKMDNRMEAMEKNLNRVLNVVQEQKKQIEKLEKEVKKEQEDNKKMRDEFEESRERISELEQRQRFNNIIINGVKQEKNEDVYKIIESLGSKLGIVNCMQDVHKAHRVNTLAKNKIKPIVVRLSNTSVRDRWTAAYRSKQLYKERLYINEHLTKTNQDLLYKAKKLKEVNGYKFVWIRDCKVMIRKSETSRIYVIRTMKDLETYMTITPPLLSDNAEEYLSATSTFSY